MSLSAQPPLMPHEKRQIGMFEHVAGDAAEERLAPLAMRISAHHDQVGAEPLRRLKSCAPTGPWPSTAWTLAGMPCSSRIGGTMASTLARRTCTVSAFKRIGIAESTAFGARISSFQAMATTRPNRPRPCGGAIRTGATYRKSRREAHPAHSRAARRRGPRPHPNAARVRRRCARFAFHFDEIRDDTFALAGAHRSRRLRRRRPNMLLRAKPLLFRGVMIWSATIIAATGGARTARASIRPPPP